jgi:hypothetical protein
MKHVFTVLALCGTVVLPLAASAQAGPPGPPGAPGMGGPPSPPSPQQRAAMEKFRADAKASAFAALTPAHAAGVQTIVAQVAAGALDRRAAAGQIDALLTPDEAKSVLAAEAKSRAAMRTALAGAGGPPPPAVAPPPGPGGPPPGGGRFGPPSAGRFLLMVSMSPRERRDTEPRARSTSAP